MVMINAGNTPFPTILRSWHCPKCSGENLTALYYIPVSTLLAKISLGCIFHTSGVYALANYLSINVVVN
uniref:Uncharacterized protein n=1 Tax=Pararge aegeria TaxID=116150 RepID=S4PTK9_9NEOP